MKAYLCPNIINFDGMDFSEHRPEEVMFLLTRSVPTQHFMVLITCMITYPLRARRVLMLFNDVLLRTRRALLPLTSYNDSTFLVLSGTLLNINNRLLALN